MVDIKNLEDLYSKGFIKCLKDIKTDKHKLRSVMDKMSMKKKRNTMITTNMVIMMSTTMIMIKNTKRDILKILKK